MIKSGPFFADFKYLLRGNYASSILITTSFVLSSKQPKSSWQHPIEREEDAEAGELWCLPRLATQGCELLSTLQLQFQVRSVGWCIRGFSWSWGCFSSNNCKDPSKNSSFRRRFCFIFCFQSPLLSLNEMLLSGLLSNSSSLSYFSLFTPLP